MLRVDGKLCGVAPEEGADEQARLMEFVVPTLSAVVGRLEALEEVRARADARADTGETTKPVDELYQTYEGTLRAQVAVAAATLPAVLKRLDVLERSIDPASARARESDAQRRLAELEQKLEARLAPLEKGEAVRAAAEAKAAQELVDLGNEEVELADESEAEIEKRSRRMSVVPSQKEDRARMCDELNENFAGAIESYYGLVQAKLLWSHFHGNIARWRLALHFVTCSIIIFATLVALHSVKDFTELVAEWDDDQLFGWGNRNQYTYFQHVYDSVFWVAWPTAFTLVLCAGVVGLTLAAKIRDMIAMYMLICRVPELFPLSA